MDTFDPAYTPNHDDGMLRYSYRNQPTIIWWNLVRLGEALGESFGIGADVDSDAFVNEGVKKEQEEAVMTRAEKLIMQAGEEYKAVFLGEYKKLMSARLGLRIPKESDFEELYSEMLDTMESLELDFNHFFRSLSRIELPEVSTAEGRKEKASVFFHKEGPPSTSTDGDARQRIAAWLEKWHSRVVEDWSEDGKDVSAAKDNERIQAMKKFNPNFIPRSWILDEVIRRVEKEGDREVLNRVMHMALNPFEDEWSGKEFDGVTYQGDAEEEQRWVGEVPSLGRLMQCSCSS